MTLKEFREKTNSLPDTTILAIDSFGSKYSQELSADDVEYVEDIFYITDDEEPAIAKGNALILG